MAKTKDQILEDIRELYGDTSVPREQTKDDLEDIAAELDTLIATLDDE